MAQSPQGQAAPPPPPLRGDPVPGGGKPGLPIPFEPVLTAATGDPNSLKIDNYINRGGYTALRKVAESMTPEDVIKDVGDSKLVGRGGAGFPTGVKWGGTRRNPGPRYLVVNADESEPGTFGNRYAIEGDPHMLVEGMLICCFAVDIQKAHIYIRGENRRGAEILERCIAEAYEKGILGKNIFGKEGFNVDMYVTRGAGAYICGEETALMESLEGRRAQPRIRPPFPIEVGGGLFGRPTVVNNVETLMCIPHIINRGPGWFSSIGNPNSPGPKVYTISGDVNKPGVYELPMGVTLGDLIFKYAGGMTRGQTVKAVSPGALACQLLTAEHMEVTMDTATLTRPPFFTDFGPVGFGAGGVIVYGDQCEILDLLVNSSGFFARESCGKCVPCREGTTWMNMMLRRMSLGGARPRDLDQLLEVARNIGGRKTLCALGDFAVSAIGSAFRQFRPDLEAAVAARAAGRTNGESHAGTPAMAGAH
jgi:NADH-quinone oxidoreductase subunit F